MRTLILLGVTAVIVFAATPAHANEKPAMFTEPYEFGFVNPCTGEPVVGVGELRITVHETADASGGVHATFHLVPQNLKAVAASGTEYRIVGSGHEGANLKIDAANTSTFRDMFNMVGEGSADNLKVYAVFHVTVNANGEPSATVENERVQCVG